MRKTPPTKEQQAIALLRDCALNPADYIGYMFAMGGTDDALSNDYGSIRAQISTIIMDIGIQEWRGAEQNTITDESLLGGIFIMNEKAWSLHCLAQYDEILRIDLKR